MESMKKEFVKSIMENKTALGIELGSTRIKSALIDANHRIIATGIFEWENKLIDGYWTYTTEEILNGLRKCYAELKQNVFKQYGQRLACVGAIGISAMMHGYLVLDKDNNLLTPFRTWRNNNAEREAEELTALFGYNIPARWSIAHLYHAIKKGEEHVKNIALQTTLEGYIHYLLTGQRIIGIGEASGMFPISLKTKTYNEEMVRKFESLPEVRKHNIKLSNIFPKIMEAGKFAGALTTQGARLLDEDGDLKDGIPFCPCEGDAQTGMTATNSIRTGCANISAGTSVFAMTVLKKELSKVYPEIDLVMTPTGSLTAMVHCNNGTSDLNAWINLFLEATESTDKDSLISTLFHKSLEGRKDCGGITVYNYVSGENITGIDKGVPAVFRTGSENFSLADFVRAQLYSVVATLKLGLKTLFEDEKAKPERIFAHGGLFKTRGVFQRYLSASCDGVPVSVMKNAGEDGAWGMSVLAMFMLKGGACLEDYLDDIFKDVDCETIRADKDEIDGMTAYTERFASGLTVMKEAVRVF